MGCVYTLPNLYTKSVVVCVAHNPANNYKVDSVLLNDIKNILRNEKIINKSIFLKNNCIQICLYSESDQSYVYNKLSSIFSNKYHIFHDIVSSIPNWLCFIQAKPIPLGLDLIGGVYFILKVDIITILNKLQEQYIDDLKSILNAEHISYLEIQKIKDYDIEIILQNCNQIHRLISYLSKNYFDILLCHKINDNKINITFTKNYINLMYTDIIQKNSIILRHRIEQLNIVNPIIHRYGSKNIAIELPGIQDITTIKKILSSMANLEFHLMNTQINTFEINNNLIPEDSEIKLDNHGNIVPLYKKTILTGKHIINSNVYFDEYNRPQVNIFLDNIGSALMSKFTQDNVGKLMATVFIEYKDSGKKDSQGDPIFYKHETVINVAMIQSQLHHSFCISGINNLNEARYLSSLLKMGSLYSPVYIEEEHIIGPTLGRKNIIQGMIACGLGVLISICFMILRYRYFGLIAGFALIMNLMLIISLMSLIPGVMLTMPSIAGIVLTLSVAIDANVLINERIKEEIKTGKPMQYSIYMGYQKAFNSIIDANITTIITAVILYIMGTGPIQNFAITTIIGVGTSMFTAVMGTRALVNLIYGRKSIHNLSI